MSQRDTRRLLLDQARLQVQWACRDAEEAVIPIAETVERLLSLLTGEGVMDEESRRQAADILISLLPHLQFQDRQRQRLEHVDLTLRLLQEQEPDETQLQRLAERLTLPEEQQALRRLQRGEPLEAILAEAVRPPSADDGVELF